MGTGDSEPRRRRADRPDVAVPSNRHQHAAGKSAGQGTPGAAHRSHLPAFAALHADIGIEQENDLDRHDQYELKVHNDE